MTGTVAEQVGFEDTGRQNLPPRRYVASLEVIACLALVVSTVVAAMVVSIGIARADSLGPASAVDGSFALAVLFGLVLGGWGLLTVLITRDAPRSE